MPGGPCSRAATVAAAASSTWMNENTPSPLPTSGKRRIDEVAGALLPDAIVALELLRRLARIDVRRQVGELVHDRVGRGGGDRRPQPLRVEDVLDRGGGAHRANLVRLLRRPGNGC